MADYNFPLQKRHETGDGTVLFYFDTSGSSFAFKAGQTVDITDNEGMVRTFSIASSPSEKNSIMIATRRLQGSSFKKYLMNAPIGTAFRVQGPIGSFTLHNDIKKAAVLLGGGIGVTPFLSIVTHATQTQSSHRIFLLHSASAPRRLAFFDEFKKLELLNHGFKYIPTVTDTPENAWEYERGRIDAPMLERHFGDLTDRIWYLCGPPGFVAGMYTALDELGIDSDDIRSEEFTGY